MINLGIRVGRRLNAHFLLHLFLAIFRQLDKCRAKDSKHQLKHHSAALQLFKHKILQGELINLLLLWISFNSFTKSKRYLLCLNNNTPYSVGSAIENVYSPLIREIATLPHLWSLLASQRHEAPEGPPRLSLQRYLGRPIGWNDNKILNILYYLSETAA